jgi:hypothetical protein
MSDQQVALIIVDRVLDLAGPSMYSDCLLDLVYDYCPRMDPGQSYSVLADPFIADTDFDIDEKVPIMSDIRNGKSALQPLFSALLNCNSDHETLRTLR